VLKLLAGEYHNIHDDYLAKHKQTNKHTASRCCA
jgi:hypothetical protein